MVDTIPIKDSLGCNNWRPKEYNLRINRRIYVVGADVCEGEVMMVYLMVIVITSVAGMAARDCYPLWIKVRLK